MLQLILTDFDGTLFPKQKEELSKEFIQKIINLTDKGVYFAVNSGRPYGTLKKLLGPLINRTVFICNDGAQIMYKNCLLYKNPIPSSVAYAICHKVNTTPLKPFAALRERNMPVTKDIISQKGMFGEDIYKLIFVKNNPLTEDLTEIKSVADKNGLRVCFEDSEYLEFCVKSSNKGVATEFLKEKFGITGETVAFGDTKGDYPMFQKADRVFIPKGAKDLFFVGAKQIEDVQNFIIEEF
ncbi:MAG: HAD family hydrolase [Acutalibacteraceae bacterium]|nr:HAD family hydrolase [Acutalibacteraceae bacterium]